MVNNKMTNEKGKNRSRNEWTGQGGRSMQAKNSTTNSVTIGGIKLIIGNGASGSAGAEAVSRKWKKVFLVTDPEIIRLGLHEKAVKSLEENNIMYYLFDDVPSDPPTAVVEKGRALLMEDHYDGVIAIGGGSVMDAAKAMNIMQFHEGKVLDYDNSPSGSKKFNRPGLPLFSIPTTSGTGSEVTQYAVITSEKEKRKATIGDPMLVSSEVFLDPELTAGLPKRITAATGIDAIAHAIEAYTSNRVLGVPGSSVFSDTYALQAVRMIAANLYKAVKEGSDLEARKQVMLGATMAGFVSQAGSGAAHGMGTPLGARYHVPHGTAVGIMLPYVMNFNADICPERMKDVAEAMGCAVEGMTPVEAARTASGAMGELLGKIDFPVLREYVKSEEELKVLAGDAVKDKCCMLNAKALTEEEILALYQTAWRGENA